MYHMCKAGFLCSASKASTTKIVRHGKLKMPVITTMIIQINVTTYKAIKFAIQCAPSQR